MTTWHLAQLNVGRAVGPLDGEQLRDFMEGLDPVNALADAAPGFVWRLQTESGNATDIKPDAEDALFIVNLSVWASIEALREFVYSGLHRDFLRRRHEWFERAVEPIMVLWWVPAGTIPTVEEALARLERLRADGPTPDAFTLRSSFPPVSLRADGAPAH
jgi:hypothetical protein